MPLIKTIFHQFWKKINTMNFFRRKVFFKKERIITADDIICSKYKNG